MSLKDILEKKKKKKQTPLRVNIVEVLDNFTIVRDESTVALLKNDERLMKHIVPQKGLLLPKAKVDPKGYLTLGRMDMEPCKIGKMHLKENEEDKKTIEALKQKIVEFENEENDDNPSFEEISQNGIKRIPRICLYVLHIGKECKGEHGSYRVMVVLDKNGQKSIMFVNHLKVLDSLKEAPGPFLFKEIAVAKTDDFTLKTTIKTTTAMNTHFDFDTVQIGEHQLKATFYHFHEPKFYENNDFKVVLLFMKEDDEKNDGVHDEDGADRSNEDEDEDDRSDEDRTDRCNDGDGK